ncbi:hypothetical protein [Saccharopolyspora hattusasensis]|uniref:hypothetical protein n=1 Tax=Saccharopolyspora hattusasensis TaxID=1128679 RepID=UPI003D9997C7
MSILGLMLRATHWPLFAVGCLCLALVNAVLGAEQLPVPVPNVGPIEIVNQVCHSPIPRVTVTVTVVIVGNNWTAERVQAAKAAYQQACQRRQEHIRQVADEFSAPTEWSDRAELRKLEQDLLRTRQEWLALAPAEPTEWWPGGYRLRRSTGTIHRRDGAGGLGVWPTRDAAEDYVRAQIAAHAAEVGFSDRLPAMWDVEIEWCAVRDDPEWFQGRLEAPVVALDAAFWGAQD